MKDVRVVIVTGSEMYELSNNVFDIEVLPGKSHNMTLQDFIRKNDLVCDLEFWLSCEQVQLASMGNIVLIVCKFLMSVSLPVAITPFQKKYIDAHHDEIVSDEKMLAIMSLYEDNGKKYFESYDTGIASSHFDDLISSKIQKVKKK